MIILLSSLVSAAEIKNTHLDGAYNPNWVGDPIWTNWPNAQDIDWTTFAERNVAFTSEPLCFNKTLNTTIVNATFNFRKNVIGNSLCLNSTQSDFPQYSQTPDLDRYILYNLSGENAAYYNTTLPKECINNTDGLIEVCVAADARGTSQYYEGTLSYNTTDILDNCSELDVQTLNITIRDSTTDNEILIHNVEVFMELDVFGTIEEIGFDENSTSAYCLYSSDVSFDVDYEFLITADNYRDTTYIVKDDHFSSATQYLNIYMVNDTQDTAITLTLVDENDFALQDYIIEIQKYNLANDNYTTVGMQTTDADGITVFNLDVSTYQYRWIVKNQGGTILLTGAKQKLTQTEYTIQIVLGTTPGLIMSKIGALDITLTANKSRKNFTGRQPKPSNL